jgi:hypothetical protein
MGGWKEAVMTRKGGGDVAERRSPIAATAAGPGDAIRIVQRDLLPLPRVPCEFGADAGSLSRGVCQRVRKKKRRAIFEKLNEMVDALNILAGKPDGCAAEASTAQLDVLARLEGVLRAAKPPAERPSPEEAARVLLGSDRFTTAVPLPA